jgi:hypothetical protein
MLLQESKFASMISCSTRLGREELLKEKERAKHRFVVALRDARAKLIARCAFRYTPNSNIRSVQLHVFIDSKLQIIFPLLSLNWLLSQVYEIALSSLMPQLLLTRCCHMSGSHGSVQKQ